MPLTVVERIARVLFERLEDLLDQDAGYNTQVVQVVRHTRLGGFTPQDRQVVLTMGESIIVPELMCPGNPPAVARRQTFNIHCHVMTDEESIEPIDTTIHTFVADVIQCVTSTSSRWHSFDELAIDAFFLDPEFVTGDGGPDGATIPLAVTYRTDEDDPYTLRG